MNFPHLDYLVADKKHNLVTTDGKDIEVYEFGVDIRNNETILSEWARHFRNQYCLDTDIDFFRKGYGYSRSEYLTKIKFPDASEAPGPGIRSGDFSEILMADYVQHKLNYWVPRTRYGDKTVRNESTKGCDIVGFKIIEEGNFNDDDALIIFEAKASLVRKPKTSRLEEAVKDSEKDATRKAESLNAIKQRLYFQQKQDEAMKIERFQNSEDYPYKETYGACAIISTEIFEPTDTCDFDASNHPYYANLKLMIVHGASMMNLVHELFRRAADEA